jgi:hypothetical protein
MGRDEQRPVAVRLLELDTRRGHRGRLERIVGPARKRRGRERDLALALVAAGSRLGLRKPSAGPRHILERPGQRRCRRLHHRVSAVQLRQHDRLLDVFRRNIRSDAADRRAGRAGQLSSSGRRQAADRVPRSHPLPGRRSSHGQQRHRARARGQRAEEFAGSEVGVSGPGRQVGRRPAGQPAVGVVGTRLSDHIGIRRHDRLGNADRTGIRRRAFCDALTTSSHAARERAGDA